MYWKHVHHANIDARRLADRHYSRQTVGAREFTPPGNKIVLLGKDNAAVWAIQRPAASSGIMRADGFKCWNNVIFRNESQLLSSDLILEAIAMCIGLWPDLPEDGLHTFIDPRHIKPIMRRSCAVYGYCYIKAGFTEVGITKSRKLIRLVMTKQQLQAMTPIIIPHYRPRLFELA